MLTSIRIAGSLSRTRCGHGAVLIYVILCLVVLLGLLTLAVDWSRVQLTRAELRRAADAAARYGAKGISDGTAVAKAQAVAGENGVEAAELTVTVGRFAGGAFSASGTPLNAVKV
ncbi:MAG: pilus assembly protein TadG-related protein, partial [Tepidisphaeraceae bacterium]